MWTHDAMGMGACTGRPLIPPLIGIIPPVFDVAPASNHRDQRQGLVQGAGVVSESEIFQNLRSLNEQIVAARKRGDAEAVSALKSKVKQLLAKGTAKVSSVQRKTEVKTPERNNSEISSQRMSCSPLDMAEHMANIRVLNELIVKARKAGRDDEVSRLKEEVKQLLEQSQRITQATRSRPVPEPEHSQNEESSEASKRWLRELLRLNQRLVDARQRGEETELYQCVDKITLWLQSTPTSFK